MKKSRFFFEDDADAKSSGGQPVGAGSPGCLGGDPQAGKYQGPPIQGNPAPRQDDFWLLPEHTEPGGRKIAWSVLLNGDEAVSLMAQEPHLPNLIHVRRVLAIDLEKEKQAAEVFGLKAEISRLRFYLDTRGHQDQVQDRHQREKIGHLRQLVRILLTAIESYQTDSGGIDSYVQMRAHLFEMAKHVSQRLNWL